MATAVVLALWAPACRILIPRDDEPRAAEPHAPEPLSTEPSQEQPLPVKKVTEPIVVAAWTEPRTLPAGGGQVQVLVRVQKRGGAPFRGVEIRLATSTGSLFSNGRILVTDRRGMTRDRLTTRRSTRITLNVGGTVYRFALRVGDGLDEESPAAR